MASQISVVGLGKLGASLVAAFASRGTDVIGVDVLPEAVERLLAGCPTNNEPYVKELIDANRRKIRATTHLDEAVKNSTMTFVVVPTPTDPSGGFALENVLHVIEQLGLYLTENRRSHDVILMSTVLPGATRQRILPALRKHLDPGRLSEIGLCYNPQFIALGSFIRDFFNPDFTLIGASDDAAGARLESFYADLVPNSAPFLRMTLENAELAKIAINTFVTTKIAFANLVGELCQRIPGCDVDAVTHAMGMDHRIGREYLTGGLGYGGPCFPRDNLAFSFLADSLGCSTVIPAAVDAFNHLTPRRLVSTLMPLLYRGISVAVLGLTYKPGAALLEGSQSMSLVRELSRAGVRVRAYDPIAHESARDALSNVACVFSTAEECLSTADLVIISTGDPQFFEIPTEYFSGKTVVDVWRCYGSKFAGTPDIVYVPIGRQSNSLL